jgi:hypothetical protein
MWFDQVVTKLLGLLGHMYLVYDQYVQYLFAGVNPSVLNRHKRGLHPWRDWFSTSLSPPFSTDGPPLSPKGTARSPI